MTVLPLFHSCVEQSGELCCCTTCCDFFFLLKQGHCCVLTLTFYFHSVSLLMHTMFSLWYLVLYAYAVYINIYYIFHIFLYLCLFAILGVVWLCNRSLTSNYVDTENISYIHMYNEKTLPRALHSPSPPRDPFFSARVSHFFPLEPADWHANCSLAVGSALFRLMTSLSSTRASLAFLPQRWADRNCS